MLISDIFKSNKNRVFIIDPVEEKSYSYFDFYNLIMNLSKSISDTLLVMKAAYFDIIITCPHRHQDNCKCRKPNPGMLNLANSIIRTKQVTPGISGGL